MADHNGDMQEFRADDCSIIVDSEAMYGFQAGETVSWSQTNNNVAITEDMFGDGVAMISNKHQGQFQFNLNFGSPCNKKMADLAASRKRFPVLVKSPNETASANIAYVEKLANGSLSDSATARQWTVICTDLKVTYNS
ncbi:hypothetical protein [Lactiplantibacillus mudanjiangensis]|uniref:DUF3277 family protein n=1 Tax=Lactiplantibacillus mudanjiangensis TaxID=1296538 RepID=A0A660DX17_9LACO|nr:hypothetical protein [Lactiplantibacillus mudanjiangensis]VDG23666.1 hypothetical protein [Lactobacillus buchneri NRRL B-30929] [Lactiplantibacillus mudanjiangensis]VDG27809.1 hypothetical protein [Lactobacillus buchneri NRRL B-30929] [Lactiplantibacillus mudanjiangensis]